jgi:hypothetical protein
MFLRVKNEYVEENPFKKMTKMLDSTLDQNVEENQISKSPVSTLVFKIIISKYYIMTEIYISLGYNCDPRFYIKIFFGMCKAGGYLTCPFDLCITNFDSLYNCIETDFKYFFDNLRLKPDLIEGEDITNCNIHSKFIYNYYNICLNHESAYHSPLFNISTNDDLFYIRNNFEELKKRYSQRIENFRYYINNYDNITFIYTHEDKSDKNNEDKLEKLKKLLYQKYINKNINIIVI